MKYYLGILLILISFSLKAQAQSNLTANNILKTRGEVYFSFKKPNHLDLKQLSKLLSVDDVKENIVFAYANAHEFQEFSKLNIEYSLVEEYYNKSRAVNMASSIADMQNWDKYPTYQLYVEMMHKFAQDYPNYCRVDTIGTSAGYDMLLLSLVISNNIEDFGEKPLFFWTGTMHGDETLGYILLLRFADYLLSNYGSNTEITNLLDNAVIFINPLANPDGTFFNHPDGSTVAESRRANINNIDLNRNFPTLDYSPTSLEPEILAMIEYSNKYPFTMSVNTHGGAEVANYPWDFWTSAENPHADDEWWRYVCTIYAGSAMVNGPTAYFKGVSSTGITEGGDWYAVSGGRQDYMMFFKNCREMCLELSNTKLVQSENLPAFWNYNKEAMLLYTQQVLFGFGGTITDSIIGEPLEAKVFVNNHDRDNSHVFSHLPNGYYHRPIYEGEYQITYSAEGYKSKTITVNTTNNQFNRLDIKLGKLELYPPEAQFSSNFTANSCSPDITFINLTESSEDTEYLWYFGDGFTSNLKNPMHSYQ
ncbi:MAG: hypothetical protein GX879_09850, partial [Bacteroidales bacterium]|nr:hypothetical protein [Bacteroidales bacterium]